MKTETLLTPEQVAERINDTPRAVREYVTRGVLPGIIFSRKKVRLRWSEVEKALEKLTVNPVRKD
jgi:excisionase family DNA binding protein